MKLPNRGDANVEDTSGQSGRGGGLSGMGIPLGKGGLGVGGLLVVIVIALLQGGVLGGGGGGGGLGSVLSQIQQVQPGVAAPPVDAGQKQFAISVFEDVQATWQQSFSQSDETYRPAKLRLYSGAVQTSCGTGQTAMGPFYCPGDSTVYLDLSFMKELATTYKAPGQFAEAYVVAHEMGHHVQNLLGIEAKMEKLQAEHPSDKLQYSVRLELQADCFAGAWGHSVYTQQSADRTLGQNEIRSALTAASAVGDDTLQKESTGRVAPDTFTHGTSAQRMRWFQNGFDSGDISACDTFKGDYSSL